MIIHDHTCHYGTGSPIPHETGEGGCVRHQRGYYQHPCGCWSSHGDSYNSLEGDW